MAQITNLRTHRKQKARDDKRSASAQTAAVHGETKADRLLRLTRDAQEKRHLDQHYTEDE
ncbi:MULTISPECIES: DUF4169 family protein [unclassified Dinoroseobacter]|uniref:DUF4169 family protein n=1 Tax=unclassified Dinoroseobacter TaxID=2620028 RepID=UPI003C798A8E